MLRLDNFSSLLSYKDILVPEKGDSQISDPTRRETYRKAISCLLVKYLLIQYTRDSQESSPTPQFKSINSSAISFLHSPTLTPILA